MKRGREALELAQRVLEEFERVRRLALRDGQHDVADYLEEVAYRQRAKVRKLRERAGVPA